jgi:hypothetical protein
MRNGRGITDKSTKAANEAGVHTVCRGVCRSVCRGVSPSRG